jgi:drug/metabolite transporter (DMT)-like permease
MFPVVSFGLGALLAGEALSPALAAGAAVTIIGVYLGALRGTAAPAAAIPN